MMLRGMRLLCFSNPWGQLAVEISEIFNQLDHSLLPQVSELAERVLLFFRGFVEAAALDALKCSTGPRGSPTPYAFVHLNCFYIVSLDPEAVVLRHVNFPSV